MKLICMYPFLLTHLSMSLPIGGGGGGSGNPREFDCDAYPQFQIVEEE